MRKVDLELPDWISRQASLGPNIEVDGVYADENYFWYLLTVCCPLIFESYAIVLHPYWINWKVKILADQGITTKDEEKSNSDYKIIRWKEFFKNYDKEFDLKTAHQTSESILDKIKGKNWPNYLWYPATGDSEDEQLIEIRNNLINIYGDIEVNFYYCLLKTHDWFGNEIIYQGKLSELEQLWEKEDIRDNPTAIYPDSKEWCIVTDYDLQFTYVGGSNAFITEITKLKELDIYPIEPMFNEKQD